MACGDTHAAAVSREGLLQTWGGALCEHCREDMLPEPLHCHGGRGHVVTSLRPHCHSHTIPHSPSPLLTPCPPLLPLPGYNEWGQLGHGRACEGLQPPRLVTAFQSHCELEGEGEGEHEGGSSRVMVRQVACGGVHTAAIDERGNL